MTPSHRKDDPKDPRTDPERTDSSGPEPVTPEDAQDDADPVPTVRSQDILGSSGILRIEHDGQTYILRLTRNRRLILTK